MIKATIFLKISHVLANQAEDREIITRRVTLCISRQQEKKIKIKLLRKKGKKLAITIQTRMIQSMKVNVISV